MAKSVFFRTISWVCVIGVLLASCSKSEVKKDGNASLLGTQWQFVKYSENGQSDPDHEVIGQFLLIQDDGSVVFPFFEENGQLSDDGKTILWNDDGVERTMEVTRKGKSLTLKWEFPVEGASKPDVYEATLKQVPLSAG